MKFYQVGGKVVASCPKCASRAIHEACVNEIAPHAAKPPIITFFRHPIARIISAYRHFNHNEGWQRDMPHYGQKVSYEEFVDSILAGNENRHWSSQTKLLSYPNFLPTHVYPFERIAELWPEVVGVPINIVNASPKVAVNENYRLRELLRLYDDDMHRWFRSWLNT